VVLLISTTQKPSQRGTTSSTKKYSITGIKILASRARNGRELFKQFRHQKSALQADKILNLIDVIN